MADTIKRFFFNFYRSGNIKTSVDRRVAIKANWKLIKLLARKKDVAKKTTEKQP